MGRGFGLGTLFRSSIPWSEWSSDVWLARITNVVLALFLSMCILTAFYACVTICMFVCDFCKAILHGRLQGAVVVLRMWGPDSNTKRCAQIHGAVIRPLLAILTL